MAEEGKTDLPGTAAAPISAHLDKAVEVEQFHPQQLDTEDTHHHRPEGDSRPEEGSQPEDKQQERPEAGSDKLYQHRDKEEGHYPW